MAEQTERQSTLMEIIPKKNESKVFTIAEFIKKYRKRITHEETGLPFEPRYRDKEDHIYTIEEIVFHTGKGLKVSVAIFSPVCFLFLGLSFLWNPYGIISTCSIAGLIGFGTNWIAIKMLFRPREPRPIFGHGLIPSQRDQLIEKVTNEVLNKLINERLIRKKIEESGVIMKLVESTATELQKLIRDEEFKNDTRVVLFEYLERLIRDEELRDNIKDTMEQKLEDFLGASLKDWILIKFKHIWKDSFFEIADRIIKQLPEIISQVFEEMDIMFEHLPNFILDRKESIENILIKMQMGLIREISIREIVMEQLESVTAENLEVAFREFSDDKLSFITILGGILGVIGGAVILWPVHSLIGISVCVLGLWILDQIVYWFLKKRQGEKKK